MIDAAAAAAAAENTTGQGKHGLKSIRWVKPLEEVVKGDCRIKEDKKSTNDHTRLHSPIKKKKIN